MRKLIEKFLFEVDKDGVLVKYRGLSKHLTIPEGVRKLRSDLFFKDHKIKSITFPSTLEELYNSSFHRSENLRKVDLSRCSKLTSIGFDCFEGCKNLKIVLLPKSLKKIGEGAFSETSIESIELPESLEILNIGAFKDSIMLRQIDLSKCIKLFHISYNTFYGCTSLSEIKLPVSLKVLGNHCFENTKLKEIDLPTSLKKIGQGAFQGCTELRTVDIPDSVVQIETRAFCGCENLEMVKLPTNLTNLGLNSFLECKKLGNLDLSKCDKIDSMLLDSRIFSTDYELKIIYPSCLKKIAFVNNIRDEYHNYCLSGNDLPRSVEIIEFGENVCKEFIYSSSKYPNLKKISGGSIINLIIEDGEEIIPNELFNGISFRSIKFPESLKRIRYRSFYKCIFLDDFKLPESLEKVNGYAFENISVCTGVVSPEDRLDLLSEAKLELHNYSGLCECFAEVFGNYIRKNKIPVCINQAFPEFNLTNAKNFEDNSCEEDDFWFIEQINRERFLVWMINSAEKEIGGNKLDKLKEI